MPMVKRYLTKGLHGINAVRAKISAMSQEIYIMIAIMQNTFMHIVMFIV